MVRQPPTRFTALPDLATALEVAERTGRSYAQTLELLRTNRFPLRGIKVGCGWFVSRAQLERLVSGEPVNEAA